MAELDIDICAMQEVSFDPMVDLPATFGHADRNAADYDWHFMPALTPDQQGGGRFEYYGLDLLSRIPLYRTATFQLGPKNIAPTFDTENELRILQSRNSEIEEANSDRQYPSRGKQ